MDLAPTPDILAEVAAHKESERLTVVGFAAETERLLENARGKLERKRLDLLVANDVSLTDSGFGSDFNKVTILRRDGTEADLPLLSKVDVADRLWDEVARVHSQQA